VAKKKSFLLRIDPKLHRTLQRWADDELRSLNAQIEYLLRRSAAQAGRLRAPLRHSSPIAPDSENQGEKD
jgi:hypothetical protein